MPQLFSHQNWDEKVSTVAILLSCNYTLQKLSWKLKITNMEAENHLFELENHLNQTFTSWWLNQPIWKILVKMGIFPK